MIENRSVVQVARWTCILATALCTQLAQAAPDWQINPGGTGQGGAQSVSMLDIGGSGFINILPIANTPYFQFSEHGAYQALQAHGGTPFGATDLTVTYSVTGRGNFLNPNEMVFSGGTIDLYADASFDFGTETVNSNYGADNGTHVASFTVFGGGSIAPGQVGVTAKIDPGTLLSGYLFAGNGTDLAGHDNVQMYLEVFNQPANPDPSSPFVTEIICGLAGWTGPGCNGTPFANSQFAFAVQDGGHVAVSVVPEPETVSMLMLGLGLLSLSTRRRQRSLR
jgi:hypothetical protein